MDNLLTILENTLSHRHNIWMFYTIIVTTVLGLAFSDSYRKLTVFPRIILSTAVGAAVWYNFYAIVINTIFVADLMKQILEVLPPEDPLYTVLTAPYPHRYNVALTDQIFYIYGTINLALFVSMWWDEFCKVSRWMRMKLKR